jgi:predicted restriction endonuclease
MTCLERKSFQYQRLEQSILREFLLEYRLNGMCQFCQDILPADLLKCAHIKKRCDCSAEEKRDINNVLLLCYKCDPLFVHGYISVVNGQIIKLDKKNATGSLLTTINSLIGRICLNYGDVNRRYFEWHRNQIF